MARRVRGLRYPPRPSLLPSHARTLLCTTPACGGPELRAHPDLNLGTATLRPRTMPPGFLLLLAVAAAVAPVHGIACRSSADVNTPVGRQHLQQDAKTCFLELLQDPAPLQIGTDSTINRTPYTPATMPYHGPYHGIKHGHFAAAILSSAHDAAAPELPSADHFVDAVAATMGGYFHDVGMGAVLSPDRILTGSAAGTGALGRRVAAVQEHAPPSLAPAEPNACIRLHGMLRSDAIPAPAALEEAVVGCVASTRGVELNGETGAAVGAARGCGAPLPSSPRPPDVSPRARADRSRWCRSRSAPPATVRHRAWAPGWHRRRLCSRA